MSNNKKTISINILSVLLILVSLFVAIIGSTNSWFTSMHHNGVELNIFIGGMKYELYQVEGTPKVEREVYTYDANKSNSMANKETSYVELEDEIIPESPVGLELLLKNDEEASSTSMYLRFTFSVYVLGVEKDNCLNSTTIAGYDEPTETIPGFIKGEDNYYYLVLKNGTDSYKGTTFKGKTEVTLMTEFRIGLDEFLDLNGSESVRLELTIEASATDYLSVE